jgi:hypothetical protein
MAFEQQIKVFSVETESPVFVPSNSHKIVAFALYALEHEREVLALTKRMGTLHRDATIHLVLVDKDIELVEQFMERTGVQAYWSGAREMR